MADRVHVGSIEELLEFRSHLMAFNSRLRDDSYALKAHWHALGEVWTDSKYVEFGDALEEVTGGIERYLEATDDHERHLLDLAERLQVVLDTRL